MIVQRKRLLEIHQALIRLAERVRGVKLSYTIARNLNRLRAEVDAIQRAGAPSTAFQEYEQKRIGFCQALCTKDVNGRPLIEDGQFVLGENQTELNRLVDKIKLEYSTAIDEREKQLADWRDLLDGEVDVKFHLLDLDGIEVGVGDCAPSLALLLEPLLGYVLKETP
jgi:hypothetical protein